MEGPTTAELGFDPLSAAFAADPWPHYARLRAAGGPVFHSPFDIWLVARHADVAALARDPAMVRAPEAVLTPEEVAERRRRENWHDMPYHSRVVQFSLLDSDGPVHDRLRRAVMREFTQGAAEARRAAIRALAGRLCDGLADRREAEFVEEFAAHIPGHVIGAVLGVPEADTPRLRRWSEDIVQFFDLDRSDARKRLAEDTTREFHHYLVALADARRRDPRDDVMTRLVRAEDEGTMSRDEMVSTAMLILMAGHGSTIDVLGGAMHLLLAHPHEAARLRADPRLIPGAVEEVLRLECPLPFFHRYATAEVAVGGRRFARGTRLGLLYGAANRDPEAFPDPDRFDPARRPNRHLAFGSGPHLCLGLHLARVGLQEVLGVLLRRFAAFEPAGEPAWRRGLSVRGPQCLPVRLVPA